MICLNFERLNRIYQNIVIHVLNMCNTNISDHKIIHNDFIVTSSKGVQTEDAYDQTDVFYIDVNDASNDMCSEIIGVENQSVFIYDDVEESFSASKKVFEFVKKRSNSRDEITEVSSYDTKKFYLKTKEFIEPEPTNNGV